MRRIEEEDSCPNAEARRAGYICSCRECRKTPDRFRAKAKRLERERDQW
jgi:hypothetical protein